MMDSLICSLFGNFIGYVGGGLDGVEEVYVRHGGYTIRLVGFYKVCEVGGEVVIFYRRLECRDFRGVMIGFDVRGVIRFSEHEWMGRFI